MRRRCCGGSASSRLWRFCVVGCPASPGTAMPETATPKTCIRCGADCAGKPRTRDSQGRYMCRPCYESAQRAADPELGASPGQAEDASLLHALAAEEAAPV